MNKAYNRTDWKNRPSDKTPINERNLNNIEAGVDEIDDRVIVLDNTKATKVEVSTLIKEVAYNEKTGVITFTRKNGSKFAIDTPMEKIALNIYYDPVTEMLTLPLIDGTQMQVDLSRLITEYEFLDSGTIAFSVEPDGKITADVKEGSIEERHLRPDYLADIRLEAGKAQASAAAAGKSQAEAEKSETNAKQSEINAKASEDAAADSASDSAGSAGAAAGSAADSAGSAASAAGSASTAAQKADAAGNSAAAAARSAADSAASAQTADEKAGEAAGSAAEALASRNAAEDSADRAEASADNAAADRTAAAGSASTASTKASEASASAAAAAQSAQEASGHAQEAQQSEADAGKSAEAAAGSAASALENAGKAQAAVDSIGSSVEDAAGWADTAKSWAVGTEGEVRPGDASDNSKYYSETAAHLADEAQKLLEQAQKVIAAASQGALVPAGTVAFAALPASPKTGYMYNISDDFTTDSRFSEGAGVFYRAGANVYWTADGKWDVMTGVQVTGVKGSAETGFRAGNVNLTPGNLGLDDTRDKDKNVLSAAKLATARGIQTDLAKDGKGSFNGNADTDIGVTGILPVAHGGTGGSTATDARKKLDIHPFTVKGIDTNADANIGFYKLFTVAARTWGSTAATILIEPNNKINSCFCPMLVNLILSSSNNGKYAPEVHLMSLITGTSGIMTNTDLVLDSLKVCQLSSAADGNFEIWWHRTLAVQWTIKASVLSAAVRGASSSNDGLQYITTDLSNAPVSALPSELPNVYTFKQCMASQEADSAHPGLMSIADKSKLDYTNVAYAVCTTAAAAAEKEITIQGNAGWKLQPGSLVFVKFSNSNTAQNPRLNVNGTGAKPIYFNAGVITTGTLTTAGFKNRITHYMYDGTNYIWMGEDIDNNSTYSNQSLGNGIGTCDTAEATAAKTVTLSGYNLVINGFAAVKFTHAVPAGATLNINGKGAKAVYYRGAAITAGIIKAGDTALFVYNGTQYHLLSVDEAHDADTVDGFHAPALTPNTGIGVDFWNKLTVTKADGVTEIGKYLDFHADSPATKDYDVRITASASGLAITGTTTGTFKGNLTGNASGNVLKAGDTMTGTLKNSITTNSWTNANKGTNVIIDSTAAGGGWTALAKLKSTDGVFHTGVWKDAWYLNYTEKSVAEGTENKCTKQAVLMNEAGNMIIPGTIQAASFTGKFTTARKIELKGDVTGSVNFDGSANVAVNAVRRGCMVGQTGTAGAGSKPWYKVASVSVTAVNLDKVISFRVFDTIGSTAQCNTRGILTVHCRMNALGVMGQPFGLFWEHVGSDVVLDNYVLAYKITANTKIDLELWTKLDRNYVRRVFDVISESDTVSLGVRNWTLYNTQSDGSQAAITSGFTQIKSVIARNVMQDVTLWDGVHSRCAMYLLDDGDGATNNGSELIIGAAGNTFIGAGEAASNLHNALKAGAGTGESYGQGAEQMYVAADNNLWLYSACQTIANRKGLCLDTGGTFRPVTNKGVNLGHSSYYFNNAYISRVIGTADWAVRNKGCNLPQVPFTAGEAITAGSLCGYSVEEKGYTKLPANILSKNFPILYIDKAYAKGAAIGINNAYSSAINLNRSVLGITTDLKPGKPIFIKAGSSSDTITPYAEYYNDELPAGSADDASFDYAKSYMLLGYSVSSTTWNLIDEHPIWSYETYPGTSRKELINNVLDDGFDWFADKKIYESTCISLGRKQGTARGHYSIVFASNSTASSGYSVSIGGTNNTNSAGSSVILGGSENTIGNLKFRSAIIAGCKNTIAGVPVGSSNNDATIIGGNYNKIYEKASNTCIIAGNSCNAHGNQLVTGHYNNISDTANTGDSPDTGTGAGSAFLIGNGTSSARSNAMRVDYNGKIWCKQAYSATGADYAELFEWEDGNPDSEDRRGYFVTMSGKLIKKAEPGDWILGVVSGNPCVLGNTDTEWVGQFLRDEFGQFLTQEYTEMEKKTRIDQVANEEGETEDVEVEYEEEVTYTGYVLNPDYDPGMEYTDRMSRPEWDAVGMMGVLSVRDDGSCEADGFCTVAEGGTATRSESGYRVVKRVNDHIVEIVFR